MKLDGPFQMRRLRVDEYYCMIATFQFSLFPSPLSLSYLNLLYHHEHLHLANSFFIARLPCLEAFQQWHNRIPSAMIHGFISSSPTPDELVNTLASVHVSHSYSCP